VSMSMVNHEGLPACQSLPNLLKEQCQEIFHFRFLHDILTQSYKSFLRFTLIMVTQAVNLSPVSTTIEVNSDSVVQQ
jgi:hypothetical protein